MLLSNEEVSHYLRENFTLAWSSVRPVPKVTIDFGNGRTLNRTLKGNTIFQVLRQDGTVLDSLPGVYQPEDFLQELRKSTATLKLSDEDVLAWHRTGEASLDTDAMLAKATIQGPLLLALEPKETDLALRATEINETKTHRSGEIVDVSAKPLSLESVRSTYLDNREDVGAAALEKDSQASLKVLRPAVHQWFANQSTLPTLAECRTPMFQDILKVKIDDPYMGLKVEGIPGTD